MISRIGIGGTILPNVAEASGAVADNWQSGVATSGLAGADLVTINIAVLTTIHMLEVDISNLTAGAQITIRMYHTVNGAEQEFYNEFFIQGTDPDSIPCIFGNVADSSNIRVEVMSNNVLDDGLDVDYHIK